LSGRIKLTFELSERSGRSPLAHRSLTLRYRSPLSQNWNPAFMFVLFSVKYHN
jgi:hypothetical protein